MLFLALLCSCKMPIAEFPYPEYLGHWRDTTKLSLDADWLFTQSELTIGLTRQYKFWKIENDTLFMANDKNIVVRKMIIDKKPYPNAQYEWKMELYDTIKYYLKKQ